MSSGEQAKSFEWADVAVALVLVLLLALGGYLAYKTYSAIGGMHGWLAMHGRWLVQLALVVAAFAAYVACFAVLHVVISLATGTRLRRVKVFISFQHSYESIAMEIQNRLEGPGIEVLRLPFRSDRKHDEVIHDSMDLADAGEAFVVVPADIQSWMAHELGHAVGSKKPIVVIKHLPGQHLSDSLYVGTPTFDWEKLRACNLVPLRRYLAFCLKGRSDVWPQFLRTVAGFSNMVVASLFAWWVIAAALSEVDRFLFAFRPHTAEMVASGWLWTTLLLLAAAFTVGFTQAFARRARGLAVARQKILTGAATYAEFSAVFSHLSADATILDVVEKAPLPLLPREHRDET